MVTKRRGKRKSTSKNLVFEVTDSDVSPDNSDNDSDEPQSKVLKTDSKFVESVVSALSNLEHKAEIETKALPSNTDEKTLQINESIVEINEESSENETKIDTQISNPDNEEIIQLDDSTDESTRKYLKNVEEGVIVIGDDTIIESNRNTHNFNNDCSPKDEDNSLIVLDDYCSSGSLESGSNNNKEAKLNLEFTSLNASVTTDIEEGELTTEIDNVDGAETGIYITFSSKSISDTYKSKFLDFINNYTDLSIVKQDDLTITLLKDLHKKLEETQKNDTENLSATKGDSNEHNLRKRKKRKKTKKEKELFTLDTKPSQNMNHVTQYSSKFQISENGNEEVPVSSQICFNCDQNHSLKDCLLPRNYTKINQMRQQFKTREKHMQRYHLEEVQKYDHLKPGKISNRLREALGLKSNQIPSYIYQMRILGYPPGWLEEAKLVYSNLALFDTEGNHVQSENMKKGQGLDSNKIIEYPGFNAPLDKHSKDEYRLHRVPSYSSQYSKNSMIEYFEQEYSKQQDDLETLDMDLDETNNSNDKEEKRNILTSLSKDIEKNVESPSLIDLETEKQNLLAALDDNYSSNLKFEDSTEKEPSPPGLESMSQDDLSENLTEESEQSSLNTMMELSKTNSDDSLLNSTSNNILNSDYGTPILKSCSPFSTLPNPSNFMKDVSPVINFENLPNATGKYEQMTGLLQKVRNTLKNVQKNKS